jgi:hypothetical protein
MSSISVAKHRKKTNSLPRTTQSGGLFVFSDIYGFICHISGNSVMRSFAQP